VLGKAAVLLDGMYLQNVTNVLQLNGKLDYQKFSDKLCAGYERTRTYVFDALPADGSSSRVKKQRFLDRLSYLDKFQVEQGYVKDETRICPECQKSIRITRQKKVDILIATRLLECSYDGRLDKIILVAGDGDFVPAVEIAKKNKEIVLAFAEEGNVGVATELKKAVDRRIRLDRGYFDDCRMMG
jgi:uncharacterized LabA/DUF88 family protein